MSQSREEVPEGLWYCTFERKKTKMGPDNKNPITESELVRTDLLRSFEEADRTCHEIVEGRYGLGGKNENAKLYFIPAILVMKQHEPTQVELVRKQKLDTELTQRRQEFKEKYNLVQKYEEKAKVLGEAHRNGLSIGEIDDKATRLQAMKDPAYIAIKRLEQQTKECIPAFDSVIDAE